MYKKKLTPKESLEIIKYRMNYDLKKTLNENISTIKEQQNDCPNEYYKYTMDGTQRAIKFLKTEL
jgi:hypothetical protein